MSIIEPKIDVLLDRTDNDRFLLCALASKRAHDINDMMRGQRDRAIQLPMAYNETARGVVTYDPESIDVKNHSVGSNLLPQIRTARCCETDRHLI